jgi:biotin transport system substrate-specific component
MFIETTTRRVPRPLIAALQVALFVTLLTLSARVRIELPGVPAPVTLQTLVVLMTGMILGPRQGAIAVLSYLGLIAIGLPLDSRGLGTAAFIGPTAGYLIAFPMAAFVSGMAYQAEGLKRLLGNLMLGLAATLLIYALGVMGLQSIYQYDINKAITLGVMPFVVVDLAKIVVAAVLVQAGHDSWLRRFAANPFAI